MIRRVAGDVWWGFTHPCDRLVRGIVPARPPAAARPGRPEPAAGALLCALSAVLVAVAGAAAVALVLPHL